MISFHNDILPLKNELFRLAVRITMNREEAEDVVQETMLKVWSRREQWEQIESLPAFCMTICRNLALDKVRHMDYQQRSETDTPVDIQDRSYAANPEEQAVQRDRVRMVRTLISALPERMRTCMQLRDIEGKSYRDIAAIVGISEEQVKVNIFRARQKVKENFKKMED
jgi:RNA polymerase sigma-70 factor (ECF subfamily)